MSFSYFNNNLYVTSYLFDSEFRARKIKFTLKLNTNTNVHHHFVMKRGNRATSPCPFGLSCLESAPMKVNRRMPACFLWNGGSVEPSKPRSKRGRAPVPLSSPRVQRAATTYQVNRTFSPYDHPTGTTTRQKNGALFFPESLPFR